MPVRFNTHKYTDKEIESKLTEREFRTLAMFELDKLRGIKIGSVINPQSKETLDMMDNLEDYGLIKRFWYDIAVARPQNRKMIPWTGEITEKGTSITHKLASKFTKKPKP